jgi:hypothetical protein
MVKKINKFDTYFEWKFGKKSYICNKNLKLLR